MFHYCCAAAPAHRYSLWQVVKCQSKSQTMSALCPNGSLQNEVQMGNPCTLI